MTKQCWGNAAIMSPRTAVALGATTGRVVELGGPGRALRVAALVLPGHADGAITLELGYGRDAAETLARGVGVDAYRLRGAPGGAPAALRVRPTARVAPPVLTQEHWEMHDRPLALHATLAHYRAHPDFTEAHHGPLPSLLPQLDRTGVQWAMTIDTGICTGCSACVVACQAENNIPVVGAREVARSREMHWLRIDRYFSGPVSAPEVINQPMLCQHCEKAPCEYVCPVNATVHSPDGLNEMVYNRCIGTRFCSNNCPYKVRRYNWFEYTEDRTAQRMQRNPDVTVRERGVMEKCTYCVQRIRGAELAARVENRAIRPGEVVTACQQACPTRAIQFASLTDRDSDMVKWRREPRRYAVLHELGTRPRTLYLARISNPNPELG
jgi:molybdopterin-containing oxidoreductase family iron-sulfur binding subunit